jgi:ABC-type branched-subunit amino acid transport system substrate-binding protein
MQNHRKPQTLHVAVVLAALATPALALAQVNGVSESEIVFGMSAALSGPAKELGQQMRIGIEAAFAAQNRAGGVQGRKLTLLAEDDGYEPDRTKGTMRDLVENRHVFGILGNVGTPTAAVALPYALDRGILFFGAFTGADLLRNRPPDRYVFNFRASYWEETAAAVKYLVEVRRVHPSQIAVFAQQDAYGDAGYEGVAYMMRKYRLDPAKILRVGYKRNTAEVMDAVRAIKHNASHIRAVVMIPTYRAATRFIEKLREDPATAGLVFTSVSFVGSTALAEELTQLGPRYADGVLVTQVVPLPTAKADATIKYQQDLAQYSAERPNFVSLEGYLAAKLLIEGLQRAGRNVTTETLVNALESIKGLDMGIGAPLSFGPSEHQASHEVWLTALDGAGAFHAIRQQ